MQVLLLGYRVSQHCLLNMAPLGIEISSYMGAMDGNPSAFDRLNLSDGSKWAQILAMSSGGSISVRLLSEHSAIFLAFRVLQPAGKFSTCWPKG